MEVHRPEGASQAHRDPVAAEGSRPSSARIAGCKPRATGTCCTCWYRASRVSPNVCTTVGTIQSGGHSKLSVGARLVQATISILVTVESVWGAKVDALEEPQVAGRLYQRLYPDPTRTPTSPSRTTSATPLPRPPHPLLPARQPGARSTPDPCSARTRASSARAISSTMRMWPPPCRTASSTAATSFQHPGQPVPDATPRQTRRANNCPGAVGRALRR